MISAQEPPKKKFPLRDIITVIITIALFAFIFRLVDWNEALSAIKSARWYIIPLILVVVGISYLSLGYGFIIACNVFGLKIPKKLLFQMAIISSVLNNVTPGAGVPAYSFRIYVAKQSGQSGSHMLAASVFHSFWYTLLLYAAMLIGVVYLSLSPDSPQRQYFFILIPIASIPLLIATVLVLWGRVRHFILTLVQKIILKLTKKDLGPALEKFHEAMDLGVKSMKSHPREFRNMLLLIALDWVLVMLAEWLCFYAFGRVVPLLTLVTGVSISAFIGIVSMLPGGMGAQEATISGLYAYFGIPFSTTAISAVLFRLLYSFVPAAVSILAMLPLIRKIQKSQLKPEE